MEKKIDCCTWNTQNTISRSTDGNLDFEGLFQAALVDQGKGVASFEPRGGGVTGVKGRLRVDFPLSGFDKTEGFVLELPWEKKRAWT